MPYGKRRYTSQTSVIDTAAVYDMNEQKLQSEINQQMHGNGYGTCSTASSTPAKVVTLDGYQLITGGMVTVKFTYAVPANATLNINSQGAKAIYYKESIMGSTAPIDASTIRAGDICTFIYDGTRYVLTNIDRWGLPATTSRSGLMSADDKSKLNNLDSSDIMDNSDVGGPTVEDSLSSIKGSLNTKLIKLTATLNSSVTAATIASWSNKTGITEDSFVVEAKFSNPSAILSDITVTKDTGSVVLTGTTGASAGTIELIMGNE